jgi:hypothetical protein
MSNSDRKPSGAKFANSNLNAVFAPKADGARTGGAGRGGLLLLAPKVCLSSLPRPHHKGIGKTSTPASAACALMLAWSMPPLRLLIIALQACLFLVLSTLVALAADQVNYAGSQACCSKASEPTVKEKGGLWWTVLSNQKHLHCLLPQVQD